MKIRRYTCNDMQEAMLKVKMDLGSEAVIMNSKKVKKKGLLGLFTKPMIEVVAAIDDEYVKPTRPSQVQTRTTPLTTETPISVQSRPVAAAVFNQTAYKPAQASVNQTAPESSPEGNARLNELESKIKNMEAMLGQIYQNVAQPKTEPGKPGDVQPAKPIENEIAVALRYWLIENEIDQKLAEKIVDKLMERGIKGLKPEEISALTGKVMQVLLAEPETISLRTDGRPQIVMFIGPTGVGKTTTLAKLAADFSLNRQKNVGLITADTYRIAAIEQLKTYAEILNIPVSIVYSNQEAQDSVAKFSDKDLILIDTAGRSHRNKQHFDELKSLINAVVADEIYLVISANTSRSALKEILEYYSFIQSYKLLFTKLDESPAPGVIINARYMTGRPLSYTTAGQSVPDDLEVANPKAIVSSFLATQAKTLSRGAT